MAQAGSESGIVDTVHLIDRYIITCRYGSFFGALDLDACGPSKCGCAFGNYLRGLCCVCETKKRGMTTF